MNRKALSSAMLAIALAASGMAAAQQGPGTGNYRGRSDPMQGGAQQQNRNDASQRRDNRGDMGHQRATRPDYRGDMGRQQSPRAYQGRPNGYDNRPGMAMDNGPDHGFRRGGRLPNEYRNRQYVVDDWRGHQLRQPPRGYHWVQAGGDYVLVAITTGVILDLLLNH